MKKEQVRCWKVGKSDELFITYPECDKGHRLITCNNCGKVYAVNVIKHMYHALGLDQYLNVNNITCVQCDINLTNNWVYYPDTYIDSDKCVHTYKRMNEIPKDEDSIIVEFLEIFSSE